MADPNYGATMALLLYQFTMDDVADLLVDYAGIDRSDALMVAKSYALPRQIRKCERTLAMSEEDVEALKSEIQGLRLMMADAAEGEKPAKKRSKKGGSK